MVTENPDIPGSQKSSETSEQKSGASMDVKLIENLDVAPGSTREQIMILVKARNPKNHAEILRTHFIDRLREATATTIEDVVSWPEIHDLVLHLFINICREESESDDEGYDYMDVLSNVYDDDFTFIRKKTAELMGFPVNKFEEMMECIEERVEHDTA